MSQTLHPAPLGRTGLVVSGAGFGCYRVSEGIAMHHDALRAALLAGINLIDTSANYADGRSERLVGAVLAELIAERAVKRSDVVVVTKGGYIQGSNYEMVRERLEAGSGFPDVVEYGDGLWHSIAPEFLEDQITRSLERLGLPAVDVFLLHNPEYYLSWAAKHGVPLDAARAEYERRIRDAFLFLEGEVERGRIAWYGISSNSFPHAADDPDFTSLETCVRIAEKISLIHHFAVIQFPANLIERGFVTEANQSGGRTLIQVAREKNLGVLINRPLNAITHDALIRLADFPAARLRFDEQAFTAGIEALMADEEEFRAERSTAVADDDEAARTLAEYVATGGLLAEHWQSFGFIEHLNDVIAQLLAPRLSSVGTYLTERAAHDPAVREHAEWFGGYVERVRGMLEMLSRRYAAVAQQRSDRIRAGIARALGTEPEGGLSSLAIRLLLGVEGVDCVLVGMRRIEYVDDVVGALRAGPLGSEEELRVMSYEENYE